MATRGDRGEHRNFKNTSTAQVNSLRNGLLFYSIQWKFLSVPKDSDKMQD